MYILKNKIKSKDMYYLHFANFKNSTEEELTLSDFQQRQNTAFSEISSISTVSTTLATSFFILTLTRPHGCKESNQVQMFIPFIYIIILVMRNKIYVLLIYLIEKCTSFSTSVQKNIQYTYIQYIHSICVYSN